MMRGSRWAGYAALVTAALLAAPSLTAQGADAAEGWSTPTFDTVIPDVLPPGNGPDIPQPPRAVNYERRLPDHGVPPVPVGPDNGLPQPSNPPVAGIAGPGAPCDLRYFVNRAVTPTGASRSTVGEPSVAASRDTVLQTGNWYAALSKDSGMSWSYVNPYTKFPSVDAGFCCDQRALYVPSHDMTVWYLQYSYSATTQRGSVRIAIAKSRTDLANGVFHSYTFNPASNFGLGNGLWLDFPDIAYSSGHLYATSNVFSAAGIYQTSVVWKMQLAQLDAGGALSYWFWTRASIGGGGSYRFVQGATDTMYMASHNSTSSMRVFRNADTPSNSSMAWNDRAVSSWSGGSYVATAPNGRNWAGRADSRVQTGYATPAEYGFMWNVGRRPASGRAQAYVRVARFSKATNLLFDQQDLFNSTWAFLYPAANVNASGEPAYTCAFGQGDGNAAGRDPTSFYRVVNISGCGVNFTGGSISVPFSGTDSPSRDAWGDYFTVQRHPTFPNTFVGTGMRTTGGSANQNQEPRYVWFGKEEDTPVHTKVTVQDNLAFSSVPVTSPYTDLFGNTGGTTSFTRTYSRNGRYEFTAPASVTVGSTRYLFCNWRYRATPTSSWIDRADGERTVAIDSIGASDDTVECRYALETTISVDDRNVLGGVPITVGTVDLDGLGNGTTAFSRRYKASVSGFSFTAPAIAGRGGQPFRRWYIGTIAQPIGQRTISVAPLNSGVSIEAEYCDYAAGSYVSYGSGCTGSNGQIPRLTSTSTPDTGNTVTHTVTGLAGPTPAVMFLGFSNTVWNGFPLPLSLGLIGSNPSCNVLADGFLQLPVTIGGSGSGSRSFTITSDPAAIGQHVYTQVIAADLFLPDPIPLVVTNGLDMRVGGSSIGGNRCP